MIKDEQEFRDLLSHAVGRARAVIPNSAAPPAQRTRNRPLRSP